MISFVKPRVVISKCIEFDFCRYNGEIIRSDVVAELKPFLEFLPVCAEMEIGLGVPRESLRVITKKGTTTLFQPSTQLDFTKQMTTFSQMYLSNLSEIDGFLLKSGSPSCGIKDVKIYPAEANVAPVMRSAGLFGDAVLKKYAFLAIEDEARLRNPSIREHFLRKIYLFARFRQIKKNPMLKDIVSFQAKNKLLLMAYSQKELKELGRITANQEKKSTQDVFNAYEQHLYSALMKAPRCSSNINVLLHSFGYFSGNLSKDEKKFFLDAVDQYRAGKMSLATTINILRSWIIRFRDPYLQQQTFFQPYPPELVHADQIDSCQNRDLWKL